MLEKATAVTQLKYKKFFNQSINKSSSGANKQILVFLKSNLEIVLRNTSMFNAEIATNSFNLECKRTKSRLQNTGVNRRRLYDAKTRPKGKRSEVYAAEFLDSVRLPASSGAGWAMASDTDSTSASLTYPSDLLEVMRSCKSYHQVRL